jgi:hypothetical protein
VKQHFFQQYFACVFHAQRYHGETVAHENYVHTGMVGDVSAREVVGSDHGDRLILAVQRLQGVEGNGLTGVGRSSTQW